MKVLLIVEHDNKTLKPVNLHTLSAAYQLGETDVLVIGHQCETVVNEAAILPGIQRVLVADAADYEYQMAENLAPLIANIATNYQAVVMASTTTGKNILPRTAALLNMSMIADVIKIVSHDTFLRPIYAGNAIATVQSSEAIRLLTIRGSAFPIQKMASNKSTSIEKVDKVIPNTLSQFKRHELTVSTRPELTAARVVVSGGRGLKSTENFKLLEKLADCLGAAIGASRAAVDAGFAPNDYQVGQTGKVVAPDLYIAIGISGAIQHLAGMKDSKVIVAINNDPDAPIFQVADYGLVADLFTVLPALQAELNRKDEACV
jgi:electron transfer flavoprotein alpha subunit